MDDWFEAMGVYFAATGEAPLAVDMALNGPPDDLVGYPLTASMLRTREVIDLYPMGDTLEGLG